MDFALLKLDMTNEQRASRRIDAKIEVAFRSGQEFVRCFTENLSKGGIYLETDSLPDPNALIELVLNFNDVLESNQSLHLTGKVVRLMTVNQSGKTTHKVAIQFINLDPKTQLVLDRYYETLAKHNATSAV